MQPNSKRRVHGADFKPQCLAEGQQPGVSVAAIALAHGLNVNAERVARQKHRPAGAHSRTCMKERLPFTAPAILSDGLDAGQARPVINPAAVSHPGRRFVLDSQAAAMSSMTSEAPGAFASRKRPRCGPACVTHLGRLVDVCVRARGGELVRESVGAQVALADKPGEQSMEDYQRLPSGGR